MGEFKHVLEGRAAVENLVGRKNMLMPSIFCLKPWDRLINGIKQGHGKEGRKEGKNAT